MMKINKVGFFIWAMLLSVLMMAQPKNNNAKWTTSLSKTDFKVGEVINVVFDVTVIDGWYIYGSDFDVDCGPMVTIVNLTPNSTFEVAGKLKTIGGHTKFDDIFECDVTYFKKKGQFVLPIKVLSTDLKIDAVYEFQTCTEDAGKCLPGHGKVTIAESSTSTSSAIKKKTPLEYENIQKDQKENHPLSQDKYGSKVDSSKKIVEENVIPVENVVKNIPAASETTNIGSCERKAGYDDIIVNRFGSEKKEKAQDIWALLVFMGVAFLSGLVALLTPCVFPMIPMTVSFFTHSSSSKGQAITKALFYGFSIVFIYVLIGTVVAKINGPGFANWLATHPLPNIIFFVLFVVFAISFLGLFEIQLPNSFVNKVDSQSDKGGFVGVFFMAFTLVLVSFSCTGPIVGTILIEAAGGDWAKPLAGMFGYALAFAIPFTLFAIFPSWLKGLPKSGGWLNTVKVSLGLLELALALKFLSVADQVNHWHLLDREVFLAIWIAIFAVLFIYLLGKISFPHDSPLEKLGVFRGIIAIGTLAFVIYLIPGMFGAPLKILSGILPPMTTQDFDIRRIIQEELGSNQEICTKEPMYSNELHLPHGLKGYFDIREAICCARKQNKPIFLDFTGHGCANCRQMEAQVWSDPRVLRKLKEDYIVVALYGDDKKIQLSEVEQFMNNEGEKITTLGGQNAFFLYDKFKQQAQPFYAVLGVDEEQSNDDKIVLKELNLPSEFNLDIVKYLEFLDKGTKKYEKLTKECTECN